MSQHQHVEDLLTKCFLYPKRLSLETKYGRYVLIYHHENNSNKGLNIVACDANHEDTFWALRTKTMYYAQWIRKIEKDELEALQSKKKGK